MNEGLRRTLPDQSSGSGHTFGTSRHPGITDPILSKRVCFYKSGDPQFNGLRMVINSRAFKTFDALLDILSKKVPLPFGVRNITTPRGVHAIYTLDELEDGKSYICSDRRKVKPINLAVARKKLPPWYHARPASSRRRTVQQARLHIHKQEPVVVRTPKRLLVFRNGDPTTKQTIVLHKRTAPTFDSVLEYISQLIQFHVVKLHTVDGRRVSDLTQHRHCQRNIFLSTFVLGVCVSIIQGIRKEWTEASSADNYHTKEVLSFFATHPNSQQGILGYCCGRVQVKALL